MSGQVHVSLIPTSAMPGLIANLEDDGFVTEIPDGFTAARRVLLCKRFHCEIAVETYPDPKHDGRTFAVVAYPPYSMWPWRWAHEQKLFNDLTSHMDRLETSAN